MTPPTIEISKIVDRDANLARSAKWVIVVRVNGGEWHTTLVEGANDNGKAETLRLIPKGAAA